MMTAVSLISHSAEYKSEGVTFYYLSLLINDKHQVTINEEK